MAVQLRTEARLDVGHAGEVSGEGEVDKTIPSNCFSALH